MKPKSPDMQPRTSAELITANKEAAKVRQRRVINAVGFAGGAFLTLQIGLNSQYQQAFERFGWAGVVGAVLISGILIAKELIQADRMRTEIIAAREYERLEGNLNTLANEGRRTF